MLTADLTSLGNMLAEERDHERRGILFLELYHRTESPAHSTSATREFCILIRGQPRDPWAHAGLALALTASRKTMAVVRTYGIADGEASFVAERELATAGALSANLKPLLSGIKPLLVRTGYPRNSKPHDVVRLLADLVFPSQVAKTGVEQAALFKTRFSEGADSEGIELYFAATTSEDTSEQSRLINEAVLIASPDEIRDLRASNINLQQTLRRFWVRHASHDAVSLERRVGEHYRRLAAAVKQYSRSGFGGAPPQGAIVGMPRDAGGLPLDDRGLVYVRYGAASRILQAVDAEFFPNETWIYANSGDERKIFRFAALPGASGFWLVGNPWEFVDQFQYRAMLTADWVALADQVQKNSLIEMISDQAIADPQYAFVAARLSGFRNELNHLKLKCTMPEQDDIRVDCWEPLRIRTRELQGDAHRFAEIGARQVLSSMQKDDARHLFTKEFPSFIDVATFRGTGCTEVVLAFAARVSNASVTFQLSDTAQSSVAAGSASLTGAVSTAEIPTYTWMKCLPPSEHAIVSFEVADSAGAGSAGIRPVAIPNYTSSGIQMSDVLYAAVEPGRLKRGDAAIAIVPTRQIRQETPFRLYYEIYNIPMGYRYRTLYVFETARPGVLSVGKKNRTEVSFESVANRAGTLQLLPIFKLELPSGQVNLMIEITDLETNQKTTRKSMFWLVD